MLYFQENDKETVSRTSLTDGDFLVWHKKKRIVSLRREGGKLLWHTKTEESIILPLNSGIFEKFAHAMASAAVENLTVAAYSHDDEFVIVRFEREDE